jgi:exopolysaccharide biosynthesis polyprenyl glycosylphosphotransferase
MSYLANNTDCMLLHTPEIEPLSMTSICEKFPQKKQYDFFKHLFDIILSVLAIICLAPILIITAIAIKIDSKGPVLYKQYRVGKSGKQFKMYKFRSMCSDADQRLDALHQFNEKKGPIFKISKDPRITKIGRIIRKLSIDELPQLINIIRGEMTIVGPRPPLINEAEQYTPYQAQRLSVVPGLTCYWQISGRSNLSFDEWVELDLKYIYERSLLTDLKIILKTIPAVLLGVGAY